MKKPDKVVKKQETAPQTDEEKKKNEESDGATGAEEKNGEENGEFQPIELPPFEIVTGWVKNVLFSMKAASMSLILICFTFGC